jgi:antitoxin component YwqK of YwqJK toxin-antitoxin module
MASMTSGTTKKEGLYEQEEGKILEHKDRISDQEEIKNFVNMVFDSARSSPTLTSGKQNPQIGFDEYLNFNKKVSSEMFYSIMSVLHERLPCAPNFFRLKKIFRTKVSGVAVKRNFAA